MGFEYVNKKHEPQKVCFGSGCHREILGNKGLTPYMRYHTYENYTNIASWTYNSLESFKYINTKPCIKSLSKKGYSGIANRSISIKTGNDYPAPWTYAPESYDIKVKQSKYPFGSSEKRSTIKINTNPGPGTYTEWTNRDLTFQHNFGGKRKLNLAVDIKCCARNIDTCSVCKERPIGEYWHRNNKEFLCNNCMLKRRCILKKYRRQHFSQFRRIRDCSGIHFHDGTDAKTWLISPQLIAKCNQTEAYLSSYFDK